MEPRAQQVPARVFNSYDVLKLLALVAMTVDHVGGHLLPQVEVLRIIGRVAAPIFCFLVGWNGQYRFRRELLLAAAIASASDALLRGALMPYDILWSILAGRMLLQHLDQRPLREGPLAVIAVIAFWAVITLPVLAYGTLPLLWMLWGREQRRNPNGAACLLYAAASVMATVAAAAVIFHFTRMELACVAILMLGTAYLLQRFRLREMPRLHLPVLVAWSRHALLYYVLHRAAILSVALVLK